MHLAANAELRVRPDEQYLFDIEKRFPGFGGYGTDSLGVRRIWVANAEREAEILQAIGDLDQLLPAAVRARRMLSSTQTLLTTFSVSTLARIRDFVTGNYLAPGVGVVEVDLDEALNRVSVGVLAGSANELREQLESALSRQGFPAGALNLYVTTMGQLDVGSADVAATTVLVPAGINETLWTPAVPLVGGILEYHWYGIEEPHETCTFGLVVSRNGVPGTISNSHCTPTTYALDSGHVVRNATQPHPVGFETRDPASFLCLNTGSYHPCRYSDAAFFQAYDSVSLRRGAIARTESYTTVWGDSATRAINQDIPFYTVTSVAQPGTVQPGMYLMKVGQTTGSTEGVVTRVCFDRLLGDNKVRLCSIEAKYFADEGDSGGPVWLSAGGSNVTLAGLHFGSNQGANRSWSSPWHQVVEEIGGSIISTTDITVGPTAVTVSFPSLTPILAWDSVTTTNSPLVTNYRVYRWTYDSVEGWTEWQQLIGTTQGLSFEDFDRFVDHCYGVTTPPSGVSYVKYQVLAENAGVSNSGPTVYCRTFGAQ